MIARDHRLRSCSPKMTMTQDGGTRTVSSSSDCPFGWGMFDEFRAPMRNQEHVAVTRENKQWFLELIRTYGPQRGSVEPLAGIACELDEDFPPGVSRLRASFGYNNPNAFDVTIPIGENNRFMGQGIQEDEGQPELFQSGQHSGVSRVIFGGLSGRGVPAWTLDGTTVEPSLPDPLRRRPCLPSLGQ
jgi:hypothetical protein